MKFLSSAIMALLAISEAEAKLKAKKFSSRTSRNLKEFEMAMSRSKKMQNARDMKRTLNASILSKARPVSNDPEFMRRLVNDDDLYGGFGFDILDYSIKYTDCAAVDVWNDEVAENEDYDGVTVRQRFAMFRLCPTDSCSNNRQYGCSSSFGEYVVELEQFLETMLENVEQKKEAYCELCRECFEEEEEEEENNNRRKLEGAAEEDEVEEEAGEDEGEEEAEAEEEEEEEDELWYCENFQNACTYWEDDCVEVEYNRDYYDDQWEEPREIEYREFVECTRVDIEGDDDGELELYIGPHCDGDAISFSVFSDEFCNEYAGDDYSPSDLIENFDSSALDDIIDTNCISCNAANVNSDEYDFEAYRESGDEYGDNYEVTEFCQQLYEVSGKCNRALNVDDESYMSSQQYETETRVCNFISEAIRGEYDQEGVIKVNLLDYAKQYVESMHTEEVTDLQIFGLVASLVACVFLAIYAAQLKNFLKGELALKKRYYYGGQMNRDTPIV